MYAADFTLASVYTIGLSIMGEQWVSEIAYLLGYSVPSAFHRVFQRWYSRSSASLLEAYGFPSQV